MRKLLTATAALALFATATAGTSLSDRDNLRIEAAWSQLSSSQRQVIELVAEDIWDTERKNRGVPYHEIAAARKNEIRAEAMRRLGFEPRRVTGVEV